ncbi:MAG: hypothetical protein JJU05_18275 [Verrucomicrobia bacterium]|nr:hypothetical protein [Verrucomicrobiota bacterium]MCH8528567.1 hypothetical protein [Kiritimatiellia bacterium]
MSGRTARSFFGVPAEDTHEPLSEYEISEQLAAANPRTSGPQRLDVIMRSESIFNKLWVVESLPEGDLKTGTALVENHLKYIKYANHDLHLAFETPKTKVALLKLLHNIRDETISDRLYPLLHLECHGCPDGLGVASGELVAWDELREILIEINQACKLNLVVVLAACHGVHLIEVSTKMDRAPFWAVIGPEEEITAEEAENDFSAFYIEFFQNLDGDAAIDALNGRGLKKYRKYHFLSAEGLFAKAYRKYYKSHCIGKGRRERIENLVTEAMKNADVKSKGVKWTRDKIKQGLANEDERFEKLKTRFFFIDIFSENAERFTLKRDDIIEIKKP